MVKSLTNPFRERPTPLGSLISAAGQRLSAELDGALRSAGFADLRAAHAPVFMAVEPAGSRLTELADRTHMTKQAVGELVGYLVDRGYLSVAPDPADRRAKRVELTDRGWQAISRGEEVISEFDAWLEQAVGAAQVGQLREVLTRIIDSDRSARSSGGAPRATSADDDQEETSMTDLPFIGKPARRALHAAGYTELEQLSGVAEADLLALHGVGPRAVELLRPALHEAGLPPMRRRGDPD